MIKNFSFLPIFLIRSSPPLDLSAVGLPKVEGVGGGLFTGLLLLFCLSCTQEPAFLPEEELLAYIRDADHGLLKQKEAGGLNMSLMYRPNELVVLQDVGADADAKSIEEARSRYQDYTYFILSMKAGEKNALYGASGDMTSFSNHLQTLSFRMGDKARLITSKSDTIPVADYVFDRTYGMGSTSLLFVFNNENIAGTDWVSFQLKDFGMRTGDKKFRFRTKDLLNVPRLKEINTKTDLTD